MKIRFYSFDRSAALGRALAAALILCAPMKAQSGEASAALYRRLGGYDAIAAVTDDFLGRLAADKQTSRFFSGVSADSLRKLRQHVIDQLCEATGGPCYYFGRSMKPFMPVWVSRNRIGSLRSNI
jgi:truncated hemoglobin YjbI